MEWQLDPEMNVVSIQSKFDTEHSEINIKNMMKEVEKQEKKGLV